MGFQLGFQLGLGLGLRAKAAGSGCGLGLRARAAGSGGGWACEASTPPMLLCMRASSGAPTSSAARSAGRNRGGHVTVGRASCGAAGRDVRDYPSVVPVAGGRTRGECVGRCAKRLMQRAEVEVRLRVGRGARKL